MWAPGILTYPFLSSCPWSVSGTDTCEKQVAGDAMTCSGRRHEKESMSSTNAKEWWQFHIVFRGAEYYSRAHFTRRTFKRCKPLGWLSRWTDPGCLIAILLLPPSVLPYQLLRLHIECEYLFSICAFIPAAIYLLWLLSFLLLALWFKATFDDYVKQNIPWIWILQQELGT